MKEATVFILIVFLIVLLSPWLFFGLIFGLSAYFTFVFNTLGI